MQDSVAMGHAAGALCQRWYDTERIETRMQALASGAVIKGAMRIFLNAGADADFGDVLDMLPAPLRGFAADIACDWPVITIDMHSCRSETALAMLCGRGFSGHIKLVRGIPTAPKSSNTLRSLSSITKLTVRFWRSGEWKQPYIDALATLTRLTALDIAGQRVPDPMLPLALEKLTGASQARAASLRVATICLGSSARTLAHTGLFLSLSLVRGLPLRALARHVRERVTVQER